ncbi:AlpA family transcriptional regulator [Roseomonas aeriglobus]|nr:AlpA family transcriptional regulator [Roseomonas aeriglobus]
MSIDRILRRKEVEKVVGLSRSAIYAAMDKGRFPRPIQLGPRAVGWRESAITDWMDNQPLSNGW